jgi:cell wall-associated NlpC family hydrolase
METLRNLQVFCCCAALWLAVVPAPLDAAPRSRKSAPAETKEDDSSEDKATASPSPSRRGSSRNRKKAAETDDVQPAKEKSSSSRKAEPSPTPAADAPAKNSRRTRKNTSADEVSAPPAAEPSKAPTGSAATSSIDPKDIQDFDAQPEPVRKLLTAALDLTRRNLTYTYGSADPGAGGMDCSGTIYYLLKSQGFDEAPRQANEQYAWVRKQARFYAVLSKKQDNAELTEMRPGDLLFWTGTYNIDRDPPVTHAMIYLGKRKKDGKRLMMGASDGRPYDGQRRNGVSVFDFKMPAARNGDPADAATAAPDHSPDFAGYGPIPGMAERNDAASRQASARRQ